MNPLDSPLGVILFMIALPIAGFYGFIGVYTLVSRAFNTIRSWRHR